MTTIFYVNFVIGLAALILYGLNRADIKNTFESKYPDLDPPEIFWAAKLTKLIKLIIIFLCPNLLLLWVLMFKGPDIKDKTVEDMYKKCVARYYAKEEHKE